MTKNLILGNFSTILKSSISKLQILFKNKFHSNWRSHFALISGPKPKKIVRAVFEKNIKISDFWLIWRPIREYLEINNFFFKTPALWLFCLYSPPTSCKKSGKSLEPLLRKLRYQPTNHKPTNHLIIINNTDIMGTSRLWSNKIIGQKKLGITHESVFCRC